MKERFWSIECRAADSEADTARRQCHAVSTEHLLDSIELLLTEYDGKPDVELVIRALPEGTRLIVVDGDTDRVHVHAAAPLPPGRFT